MKELQKLIKKVEVEINKTPTGELRNLLCDANIVLQQQALNIPVVSKNERSEVAVCDCHEGALVFNEVTQELMCACGRRIKITN